LRASSEVESAKPLAMTPEKAELQLGSVADCDETDQVPLLWADKGLITWLLIRLTELWDRL
jgi:hypothetical protein